MGSAAKSIFHVLPTFAIGGVQVRMTDVINGLDDDFHHTILSLDGDYACSERISETLEVDLLKAYVERRGLLTGWPTRRMTLDRIRPSLLMTYNWGAIDWAFANAISPVCRHIHLESGFGSEEADRQIPRRVLFRRIALARTWRIVVPSHTLFRVATQVWGFSSQMVTLIPNGVDCTRFVPAKRGTDTLENSPSPTLLVIGALGPLRPEKNLSFLLEAVAALQSHADVRLKIIGKGPDEKALKKKAADLGITANIVFTGHSETIERELAALDVFALTSRTEQMPNSVLQAMAAGKTVVATDVGDVRVMVSAENRTLITPKDDLGSFVKALDSTLSDPVLRARVGAANRAHVQKHYTRERMLRAYAELIASSLDERDPLTHGRVKARRGARDIFTLRGE